MTDITEDENEKIRVPMNILTASDENSKIPAYSARKINTNPTDEYSILNPETSSDSPSEKSKGVRLVSAIIITNHIIATIGYTRTIKNELFWIE